MNTHIITIREKNDFERLLEVINSIFKINYRLPNQVFNSGYCNFLFEEFDWAMSADFWDSFLRPLALASQDNHILVAVLDPDPVSYFYRKFGYYGLRKLSVNITGNNYFKILGAGPEGSPADAMLFDSEIVVWMPMSKKWALWGERSYGICILAFADENIRAAATPLIKTWKSTNAALSDFVDINFRDKKAFQIFADNLIRNYA